MKTAEQLQRVGHLRSQIKLHEAAIRTLRVDLAPLEEAIASDACGFAAGDIIEWGKRKGAVVSIAACGTKTSFVLNVRRILKGGALGATVRVYSFDRPRKVTL